MAEHARRTNPANRTLVGRATDSAPWEPSGRMQVPFVKARP